MYKYIVLVQHYQVDNYLMFLGDVLVLNIQIMKHTLMLWKKLMLLLIELVQLYLQKFKAMYVFCLMLLILINFKNINYILIRIFAIYCLNYRLTVV